jgi:Sel1 repeat
MPSHNIVTLIRAACTARCIDAHFQRSVACSCLAALLLLITQGPAHANQLGDDLQTVWEALWDQRGMPRPITRWHADASPIRYRIAGVDAASHKPNIVQALEATAASTGLKFTDVSGAPEADTLSQLDFDIVKEITSDPAFGCFVKPVRFDGWHFAKVSVVLKSTELWRCVHHEMMHAMGIPGHPSGNTVLSYFKYRQDQLAPLDRVMLQAWYAPEMVTGASPFKALPVLAQYVAQHTAAGRDPAETGAQVKQFLAATALSMEDFANGVGGVPTIVRRSGFASETHIAEARKQIMTMLGVAYTVGDTVPQNGLQAMRWFTSAAEAGHDTAQYALGISYFKGTGFTQDKVKGYRWLTKAASGQNSYFKDQLTEIEKSLPVAELEQLRQGVKE